MDQHQTKNFLRGRNEQMDRIAEKMFSHKCWIGWKISVQCVREINFFRSDFTVIILYCRKLISYNWIPYLSVTPRIFIFCNWFSTRRQWWVKLYRNRKETAIYKRRNDRQNNKKAKKTQNIKHTKGETIHKTIQKQRIHKI
jgi:hypothetical protein